MTKQLDDSDKLLELILVMAYLIFPRTPRERVRLVLAEELAAALTFEGSDEQCTRHVLGRMKERLRD